MKEVTREEFFGYIGPRDIIINCDSGISSIWETRSRIPVGETIPSWKNPEGERKYFLTEAAYAELKRTHDDSTKEP